MLKALEGEGVPYIVYVNKIDTFGGHVRDWKRQRCNGGHQHVPKRIVGDFCGVRSGRQPCLRRFRQLLPGSEIFQEHISQRAQITWFAFDQESRRLRLQRPRLRILRPRRNPASGCRRSR